MNDDNKWLDREGMGHGSASQVSALELADAPGLVCGTGTALGANLTDVLRSVSGAVVPAAGGGTGTAFLGDLIASVSEPRAATLQATPRY